MESGTARNCSMTCSLVALAAVLIAAGCGNGSDWPTCYPVTGKVLVDGEPAVRAIVAFHPLAPSADGKSYGASTFTDDDGAFRLTTFEAGDGALPGEYRVTVVANFKVQDGQDVSVPDLLGGKYADAATSELKVTVREEENAIPSFELKSR